MPLSTNQIQADFQLTDPIAHLIAEEWVNAAKALKATVPTAADLAQMITGAGYDLTMQGAPQLQINLIDENWSLMDSGFFDPNDIGRLDKIDIQYGTRVTDGTPYHWRIWQFSPSSNFTIQTYWIPRVVAELMSLHGPFKASRSRRTRAEFLSMCARKVPFAVFHSKQLDQVQPVAKVQVPTDTGKTLKAASAHKTVGISESTMNDLNLQVQGKPMGDRQRQNVNSILRVADKLGAGLVATQAAVYAGIWESNLEVYAQNAKTGYWGVFQASPSQFSQADVVGMATSFFQGGKGFQHGGAIASSATIKNPIEIAVRVEVPSLWPQNAYAAEAGYPGDKAALDEVNAIIQAGGGATGSGGVAGAPVEPVQQYNFSIGTQQDPHEDYWTGMNRLAQEVNWELVVDGDDIYYDSDRTLARQQLAAVVDRNDPAVDSWNYDWNRTQLPTNFSLVLECEPFEFSAGQVLQLTHFGPASVGSTMGLPGRWLIGEIQRRPGDIVETYTLVQPQHALREPAPQLGLATVDQKKITLTGKGVNPFALATGFVAGRTDMGVDASMQPGSQIVAPFDSKYIDTYPNWYQGQPYMAFEIVGGTYNGWAYYLAEQINPATFKKDQIIKAGTVIATYASTGTGIEMGLANPKNPAQTLAQGTTGYTEGEVTTAGKRWRAILKALGAPV